MGADDDQSQGSDFANTVVSVWEGIYVCTFCILFHEYENFYIFLIKKQTLNIANCFTLVSTCASVAAAWAISYNGLPWAGASPCSGGCSNIDISLSSGYSYATASEYANKPSDSDFSTSDSGNTYYYSGVKCDANFFLTHHIFIVIRELTN
jgi:hypothetical protein